MRFITPFVTGRLAAWAVGVALGRGREAGGGRSASEKPGVYGDEITRLGEILEKLARR
jgi:hypothetical protein